MVHLLCQLEILTMNINLTKPINSFSGHPVWEVSLLMGLIEEIRMSRTGGDLV